MIKKIISVILAVCLISGSIMMVFADEALNVLQSLEITPSEISEDGFGKIVSRESFSYMAAKLSGSGELPSVKTAFSDVDETNKYSGYINYLNLRGIISGGGDGKFNPKDNLSVGAASKILVTILGYKDLAERKGGYSGGYESVAIDLGLYKNVASSNGYLTNGGAVQMVKNALCAPMASGEYINGDNGLEVSIRGDKDTTILNSVLKLNGYKAYVEDVSASKNSITVTIFSDYYGTNKVSYEKGIKKTFSVVDGINVSAYKYASVIIMVDSDENVVSIAPGKDVSIKTLSVSSVNGDYNENSFAYKVSEIDRMTFVDDETEYDVSENLKIYFNGKKVTDKVSLIGKTARVVWENGEITSIESWDLVSGGLITAVNSVEITYTKGERSGMVFKNLDAAKDIQVYIDGKSAAISDIKPNSVFTYYQTENTLILVISEKVAVDVLLGISDKDFEIGGFLYYKNKDVYYKSDENGYKLNLGEEKLLGNTVKAYFAPNGKVSYMEIFAGDLNQSSAFLGVVTGFNEDILDEKMLDVKVMSFKPEVKEDIYKINEKTVFYDGLSKEILKTISGTINSNAVFEFETRADGKILSVKRASWFSGYGETVEKSISSFGKDAVMTVNSKAMFIKNQLTLVDKIDGEIKAKNVSYSSLASKSVSVNIAFFVLGANKEASLPDLIFVYGQNGREIGEIINTSYPKRGIMYKKEEVLDEEGELCVKIYVQVGTTGYTYNITPDEAAELSDCAYITYSDVLTADKNYITITENRDLTKPYDEWYTVENFTANGWHRGEVERVDNHRIATKDTDGTIDINFYHTSYNFFLEIDKTKPEISVKSITSKDILPGDKVYYNITSEGLKGVILVKE